jgi:hypothetical protein
MGSAEADVTDMYDVLRSINADMGVDLLNLVKSHTPLPDYTAP